MSKKILILDDEGEYLLSIQRFLHEFNYAVCIAASSSQALDAIQNEKPDLVLFDYKLPDMDGYHFLEKAKSLSPETSFILVTAWNEPALAERAKKMGASDVILKPINLEKLLTHIQTILKE